MVADYFALEHNSSSSKVMMMICGYLAHSCAKYCIIHTLANCNLLYVNLNFILFPRQMKYARNNANSTSVLVLLLLNTIRAESKPELGQRERGEKGRYLFTPEN